MDQKPAWFRYSKVAPLNQPVRAVNSEPLLFEAPSSNKSTDANFQFIYDIHFAPFVSWGNGTSDYFVAPVSSINDYGPIYSSQWWYMK